MYCYIGWCSWHGLNSKKENTVIVFFCLRMVPCGWSFSASCYGSKRFWQQFPHRDILWLKWCWGCWTFSISILVCTVGLGVWFELVSFWKQSSSSDDGSCELIRMYSTLWNVLWSLALFIFTEISLEVITADKCALTSSSKSLLNFTSMLLLWQRGSCLGAYFRGTMFDCMTFLIVDGIFQCFYLFFCFIILLYLFIDFFLVVSRDGY